MNTPAVLLHFFSPSVRMLTLSHARCSGGHSDSICIEVAAAVRARVWTAYSVEIEGWWWLVVFLAVVVRVRVRALVGSGGRRGQGTGE